MSVWATLKLIIKWNKWVIHKWYYKVKVRKLLSTNQEKMGKTEKYYFLCFAQRKFMEPLLGSEQLQKLLN